MIAAIVGGNVPIEQRRPRAAELLRISTVLVDAALAYHTDFTEEIDADLAARTWIADETEASWRRQRALLES